MPKMSYWLLLLTIILLPWYVVRFSIGPIPTTLLEVLVLLTSVVWVIETLYLFLKTKQKLNWRLWVSTIPFGKMWFGLVLLLLISGTISLIIAPDLRAGLGIYKAYIVEPVIIFIIALLVLHTPRRWWGAAIAVGLVLLEISLVVLSQWLFGWPVFAPAEMAQGRPSAVFNTANAIGLLIGPVVVAAGVIGLGLWHNSRSKGTLVGFLFALGVICIFLSQSMGAIVGLVAAGSWSIFLLLGLHFAARRLTAWYPRLILLMMVAYLIGTLGYMFIINNPPTVVNPYTRPGFTTMTVRQCTWEGTTRAIQESPVFGFGLAGFTENYLQHSTCDAEPLVYPHNLVLNLWSEIGLLGLISMLSMICLWIIAPIRLWMAAGIGRYIGIAVSSLPIYWLIHGIVDVPYFKNDLSIMWWILLALSLRVIWVWSDKERAEN